MPSARDGEGSEGRPFETPRRRDAGRARRGAETGRVACGRGGVSLPLLGQVSYLVGSVLSFCFGFGSRKLLLDHVLFSLPSFGGGRGRAGGGGGVLFITGGLVCHKDYGILFRGGGPRGDSLRLPK